MIIWGHKTAVKSTVIDVNVKTLFWMQNKHPVLIAISIKCICKVNIIFFSNTTLNIYTSNYCKPLQVVYQGRVICQCIWIKTDEIQFTNKKFCKILMINLGHAVIIKGELTCD